MLLAASAPLKKSKLAKIIPAFEEVLIELKESLIEHGIQIFESCDEIELVTREEFSQPLKDFFKWESEELSPSLTEVLSIIAYAGPISRAEIEKIRGVNSIYSLKKLLLVGLIEKTFNPQRKNVIFYKSSAEFLKHLGITKDESLPNYFELRKKICGQ
jgi:segregation and condensation protein B